MKLLQRRIQEAARRSGVNQLVVERDYAQSYVLLGIASQPLLQRTLVFKGGTALKKIYFEDSPDARQAHRPRLGSSTRARFL